MVEGFSCAKKSSIGALGLALLFFQAPSYAQGIDCVMEDQIHTSQASRKKIPTKTSTPKKLGPKKKVQTFGCKRQFRKKRKLYSLDSYHRRDGEGLRKAVSNVPAALSQVDLYQENRRSIKNAAYIGTAGIGLIIGGLILSNQYAPPTSDAINTVGTVAGALIAGGSFTYAWIKMRTNEQHLKNAVKIYNENKPNDQISLEFTTKFYY